MCQSSLCSPTARGRKVMKAAFAALALAVIDADPEWAVLIARIVRMEAT